MWFASKYGVSIIVVVLISSCKIKCDPGTNTFNASLRDFSLDNNNNVSHVKTLQKEEVGKQTHFVPAASPVSVVNPIKFKESSDSALSTSNSRGLTFHDHPGFILNDYEEGPHFEYGHDYHFHDPHLEPHGGQGHGGQGHGGHLFEHGHHEYPSGPHHYGGHYDHGHGHYKHYKHALASKAVLWPLAGLALLGAAAALVSNPILLQLGVVSGKRRRRDTEEIMTETDFSLESIKKYTQKINQLPNEPKVNVVSPLNNNFKRRLLKTDPVKFKAVHQNTKRRTIAANNGNDAKRVAGIKGHQSLIKPHVGSSTNPPEHYNYSDEDKFIPIPIKLRSPKQDQP